MPASIPAVQAFMLLTFVFLGVLMCLGCRSSKRSSPLATVLPALDTETGISSVEAFVASLAVVAAVITFALIASNEWYQDMRLNTENSYIPLFNGNHTLVALELDEANVVYGPTFVVLVLNFLANLFILGIHLTLWRCPPQIPKAFYGGGENDHGRDPLPEGPPGRDNQFQAESPQEPKLQSTNVKLSQA